MPMPVLPKVEPVAPPSTVTVHPGSYSTYDENVMLGKVTGVAVDYELWMDDPSKGDMVLITRPTSGPFEAIKSWHETTRSVPCWHDLGDDEANRRQQEGAMVWVVLYAIQKLRDELD